MSVRWGKCVGRFGTFRSVLVKYAVGNIGQSRSVLCGNDCPLRVSKWGGLAHLGNFCLQNSPNGQQRYDKSQQGGVNGKACHSVIFYQLHKEIYGYKSR